MPMRISDGAALIGLALTTAACGSKAPDAAPGPSGSARIACQPAGATKLANSCEVEREVTAEGLTLTIHHPDGSFRRLLVTKDGRGVVAADGAEPAIVRIADTIGKGSEIEVALAGNRYILPAKIKGSAPAAP